MNNINIKLKSRNNMSSLSYYNDVLWFYGMNISYIYLKLVDQSHYVYN